MSDSTTPQDGKAMSPASAGSQPLQLFICSRWSWDDPNTSSWMGALLILAPDEQTAREVFVKAEYRHEQPNMVEVVEGAFGTGEARIIYDDDCR